MAFTAPTSPPDKATRDLEGAQHENKSPATAGSKYAAARAFHAYEEGKAELCKKGFAPVAGNFGR